MPAAAAAEQRATRVGVRRPLVVGGAVAAATALVAVWDPHRAGSYGFCPLRALTGLWCPACGGLRATHDLVFGDVAGAWAMNPLWVAAVPLVVAGWVVWLVRSRRGLRTAPPAWVGWAGLALMLLFGVLRNLPATAAFLRP